MRCLLSLCLALAPAVALTAPAGAAAAPSIYVQVGPIRVHGGWTVTLTDAACGSRNASDLAVRFARGGPLDYAEHDYTSTAVPECRVARGLTAGSLNVKWAHVLDLSLTLADPQKLARHPVTPVGCTGTLGQGRAILAEGTLDIAIHTRAWGRVALRRAAADVATSGTIDCAASKPPNAYDLSAGFSSHRAYLLASENTNGRDPDLFVSSATPDSLGTDVTGSFGLSLGATGSVDISAPNATLAGVRGFTTGSLQFHGDPPCTSSPHAYNGTLTGTLIVDDPIFGDLALAGPAAQYPSLGLNAAPPGDCNGAFYQPLKPLIDNSCDTTGVCSASAPGQETVTFSDGTSAGNNTIASESFTPYAGAAAIPITNQGTATYTYPGAGTYVATLTVTYRTNQVGATPLTATAQTTVNIGS